MCVCELLFAFVAFHVVIFVVSLTSINVGSPRYFKGIPSVSIVRFRVAVNAEVCSLEPRFGE